MKFYELPFLDQDKSNFDNIVLGKKTVETRAGNPLYLKIQAGDSIRFSCQGQTVTKRVVRTIRYPNPEAAIAEVGLESVMPGVNDTNEALSHYDNYPGYKIRIKQYGINAFFLG